jgi:NAD(P)-dependent dehydrogenase (short-subunit alcohol dehydrogenase family)
MPATNSQPTHGNYRRVALVTGGTGAIGKAIERQSGNPQVRCALADLGRRVSIRALAQRWSGPLHVLINNAATTPRRREETPEDIERQFATNVLGYFWMIEAFQDRLTQSAPARVVNVASYWAGGLARDDLEFRRRRYDNNAAYRQSKQADRMLSAAFAARLAGARVTVNACHPGDVVSTLSRSLGFGGHETPTRAPAPRPGSRPRPRVVR